MKITNRRIRSLEKYLVGIQDNEPFYITYSEINSQRAQRAGFTENLMEGEQVIPAIVGSSSKFNTLGGLIIHRDQAKETVSRTAELKDWHGNYHWVTFYYQRYPRTKIDSPELMLTVKLDQNGQKIICSPQFIKNQSDENAIIHCINLFLELFGECDTVRLNMIPVLIERVIRLNWNVLPRGSYPWNVLRTNIQQTIGRVGDARKRTIEKRLEIISAFNPDFVAVGNAGFNGYVVFGFPNKNFYILESIHHDNATYIFGDNWEQLSQLTKKEILNQNLYEYRFVHREQWPNEINGLFTNI